MATVGADSRDRCGSHNGKARVFGDARDQADENDAKGRARRINRAEQPRRSTGRGNRGMMLRNDVAAPCPGAHAD